MFFFSFIIVNTKHKGHTIKASKKGTYMYIVCKLDFQSFCVPAFFRVVGGGSENRQNFLKRRKIEPSTLVAQKKDKKIEIES